MSALPAPYPPDTRAKGWRFELDYEVIDQSTTWSRAKPEARPWLLMLWMVSWKQVPCGSLPDDPEAIAGAIGIPDEMWAKHQLALMRGWWKADDGRLYHDTVTKRVLEMIEYRRKEAARRAGNRGKTQDDDASPARVPRDNTVTPHVVAQDSTASPDTGTGTTSSPTSKKVAPRKRAAGPPCPEGVDAQVWTDWLDLRREKKAPVTPTVIAGAIAEATKAGMGLEAFLRLWCVRGTQGLQADWLKPHERQQTTSGPLSFRERDEALATARVHEMTGGLVSAKPPGQTGQIVEMPNAAFKLG